MSDHARSEARHRTHEMHPSGAFLNLKHSMSYIRYTQFSSLLIAMGAFPAWIGFIHSPLAVITFEHVESRSESSVFVFPFFFLFAATALHTSLMALKGGVQFRWQHWCNHRGQCMTLFSQSLLLEGFYTCSRSSQSACRCYSLNPHVAFKSHRRLIARPPRKNNPCVN